MAETTPLPMCPMASMCKGMTAKSGFRFWMLLPGLILIALGVAIVVFPQILAWLVAIVLIGMGLGMLMMMNFMRDMGKRLHHGPS